MRAVRIRDETFARLQKVGTPFRGSERGTPDKAISALLDAQAAGSSGEITLRLCRDEANTLVDLLAEQVEREQNEGNLGHTENYLATLRDKILATTGVH